MGKYRYAKYNRKVNRAVRLMNKNIENDNLWKGRFYIHQKQKFWREYEDHSGVAFLYCYEFIDKKTNFKMEKWLNYYDIVSLNPNNKISYHLWEAMNKFIIEDCKVWDENPAPSIYDSVDYTNNKKWKNYNAKKQNID